ncbi:hypothetical protein Patl1_33161 [Pistacia atlantica]|uniref:Uncharacterized protein n=1 Tax=Pistacia atlantica TaxID=434234 RepID=A0ACC1AMS6_9ROSI|nr:hypothetical protein Patl1_33161 [Pistacia atlantica]
MLWVPFVAVGGRFWSVVDILSSDFFSCCPCPMLFVGIVGFLGDHAYCRALVDGFFAGCSGVLLAADYPCLSLRHGIQFEGMESYLIDMYAKSGLIRASQQNFERNHTGDRDQATWNAMIAGYTQNGLVEEAFITFRQMFEQDVTANVVNIASVLPACNPMGNIELAIWASNFMDFLSPICWTKMSLALSLFRRMQECDIEPDAVTFVAVLSACSYASLVDEGLQIFELMESKYKIQPSTEHYCCAVDMLEEGNWENVDKVRKEMRERGLRKEVGCSWIDTGGYVNRFASKDQEHPQSDEIYETLEGLAMEMKNAGYRANQSSNLDAISQFNE